jgi:hypothetical protein
LALPSAPAADPGPGTSRSPAAAAAAASSCWEHTPGVVPPVALDDCSVLARRWERSVAESPGSTSIGLKESGHLQHQAAPKATGHFQCSHAFCKGGQHEETHSLEEPHAMHGIHHSDPSCKICPAACFFLTWSSTACSGLGSQLHAVLLVHNTGAHGITQTATHMTLLLRDAKAKSACSLVRNSTRPHPCLAARWMDGKGVEHMCQEQRCRQTCAAEALGAGCNARGYKDAA